MSEVIDSSVFDAALAELRRRSQLKIYQTDFDAWCWDILRLRNYEKMRAIVDDALFAPIERTMVKSGNGTGKSVAEAEMILWAGSVFPEGETVSIVSAPSIPQLQKVTFAYLKSFHGRVNNDLRPEHFQIPGRIDENLGWVSETPKGKIWLASGRKPPDQDAVSMFQGLRSQFGMTYVWFDEAGGMGRAMYTAAEAVMTGELARFFGIGNPDNAGTDFQMNFEDPDKAAEYNLHTISAFDTPVFTGERVYPRTSEGDRLEAQMLRALTSKRWVAHKSRIWASGGEIVPDETHRDPEDPSKPDPRYFTRRDKVVTEAYDKENVNHLGKELTPDRKRVILSVDKMKWDARGLSKVLGEFPGENDTAFFPQSAVTNARSTEIAEDFDIRPILGVDVARYGSDESVIFVNRGGHCRVLTSWGKASTVETARTVHSNAQALNAAEVRIDAAGVGGGVYDMLNELDEFASKKYLLIGVDGGKKSSNPRKWANSRAENHDQLRALLVGDGTTSLIDLDYDDNEIRDQLLNVTFKFAKVSGAIQITPKDEMRTEMEGSPDRLDALIYACIDTSSLFEMAEGPQPGDIVLQDPWEMVPNAWWADDNYPL